MSRGRPPSIDNKLIAECILKYKDEIICEGEENSIVKETNSVWKCISEDLGSKIKPGTLYSYVVNNRFDLKTLLLGTNTSVKSNNDTTATASDSDFDEKKKSDVIFTLTFGKAEFDALIIQASRNYKCKKGKKRNRIINVLKPGHWAEIISKKIYHDFRLNHGYHFKNNYINSDRQSGSFTGQCKCGSQLECRIEPPLEQEEIIKVKCKASAGNGNCGKRQCRAESRKQVASELTHESVESFRSKTADKLMNEGDKKEPPHLYDANVLRNVKYEAEKKKYIDPNPMSALCKYKKSEAGKYIIKDIGLDPVKVYFWSSHQNRLYNLLIKEKDARLCIDATGKIAKRVINDDGEKSHDIFLYFGVLHSSNAQFAVPAMFSERHDTVTIHSWLMRWIQSGAEIPKEVVCDSSKALLNACCLTFTRMETTELYAESCMAANLPQTFIRIDVAHYMKNWADFLKSEKKIVKQFYLFAIGQLILSRNQDDATRIIESLLLISQSETAGEGAESLKESLDFIKILIKSIPTEVVDIVDSILEEKEKNLEEKSQPLEVDKSEQIKGVLKEWATLMEKKIVAKLKCEEGDDINPRYCPKVATRLLDQIKTIPLWSCICRDNFGYGRVPASSAPVESEFKIIKKQIIIGKKRIDEAVKSLVNYYNGKLKFVDCNKQVANIISSESRESEMSTNSTLEEESLSSKNLNFTDDDIFTTSVVFSEREPEISTNSSTIQESFYSKNLNFIDEDISIPSPVVFPEREPLKDVSSSFNSMEKPNNSSCIACKNGDFPSGSHTCIICQKNVHVLEGCSIELDEEEEGHGQKRICIACSQISKRKARIALNEVENWRNLGHPRKKPKRALYLNKTNRDLDDCLYSSKCRYLPTIKNGDKPTLKFVNLEKEKFSLQETCSLDSLFQILLAGVNDNEKVRQYVEKFKEQNDLFEMVLGVTESQINASTYKKRTDIFLNYLKIQPKPNTVERITCACNVVSLATFLFTSTSSFEEISICPAGCPPRIKSLPTITITQKELYQPLENVIKDHVILPGVRCRQNSCDEIEKNEIHKIGDIIVIGVDMSGKIELKSICKSFVCPKSGETYSLLGVVEYRGKRVLRRSAEEIGHYVAIVKRNINWLIYDDCTEKPTLIPKNYKLSIELLIYVKK